MAHAAARTLIASVGAGVLTALNGRGGGAVSAVVPRTHGYLPYSMGGQDYGKVQACANEWRVGVCEKPRIKCGDCGNRLLIPLSDAVLYDHLAGEHTVDVYPLLEEDTCYFLAIDFDEAEWRADARAFAQD